MRKIRRIAAAVLALAVLTVGAYLAYVLTAYYRLEDSLALTVENNADSMLKPETEYTAMTYNVGFFAYSADYSFFMDGGTESRARSVEAAEANCAGAAAVIQIISAISVLISTVFPSIL